MASCVVAVVCAVEPDVVRGTVGVTDYLPAGYATDGSVCYQQEIQRAMDAAVKQGEPLRFPAMTYRLVLLEEIHDFLVISRAAFQDLHE